MVKLTLLAAAATVVVTAAPLFVVSGPAQSENLKVTQVDIRRDQRIEVGPGGVTIGPKKKQRCRTVTTTVETPDGRKVTKKERRCED